MCIRDSAYYQYGLTTNYGYLGGFIALPATNTTLTLPGLVLNASQGAAGASWTQTSAPVTNSVSIASSADGSRLAAVVGGSGGPPGLSLIHISEPTRLLSIS